MASDQTFVDQIAGLLVGSGTVEARKLFGEYSLYLDGKLVALICDNQVFVKPTEAGRAFLGEPVLAPPYPGAKPSFRIDAPAADRARFVDLVQCTARELPEPKPKKKKLKRPPGERSDA